MAQRAHSRPSTSGRGRHRKPSNHARNVGLATAPLFAAIPMVTASPASAAGNPWERLAGCESGGNWHINTGNGYYGGVQFSDPTWDGNGGERFASRADLASKAEQIIIAARVLEGRGWSPWPACSSRLGLGAEERREALAIAEDYRQQLRGDQTNGDATQPVDREEKAEAQAREARVTTERATRGKHRKSASVKGTYVVKRGDTLAGIARSKGVPGGWQSLYKINKDTIGRNPGLIFPGQRLTLR